MPTMQAGTALLVIAFLALSSMTSVNGQSTCDASLLALPWSTSTDDCGILSFEFGGCCGNSLEYTFTSDGETEPICSVAIAESEFCATEGCDTFTPNSTHEVNLDITFTYPDVDDTCCRKCKCYGDPLCEAFDGSTNQMIECDARNFTTCKMEEDICGLQFDHAGNKCKWLKNNPDYSWWNSNLEDGSPCQADYSVSGQMELVLVNSSGVIMSSLIGERGVQTDFSFQLSSDSEPYTINSDDCFEYDPRDVGDDDAATAWQLPSGVSSIPSTWSVSTPNDVEIRWHVGDTSVGFYVDVICNKAVGASRTRLDIENITDTRPTEDSEGDGYCFTNVIDSGLQSGTNVDNSVALHFKCLSAQLPDLANTCKALADDTCYLRTIPGWQQYWCETAELENTQASVSASSYADMVATCLTEIRDGTSEEQSKTWINYACQMNSLLSYNSSAQNSYVTECVNAIEENGWYSWAQEYNGVIPHQWTSDEVTCASSLDDFTSIPDDLTCATGLVLEVNKSGEWTPIFYFPPESPPCSDADLSTTGDKYPDLFLYRIRFRQCGLGAECLVAPKGSDCKPLSTVSGSIDFPTRQCSANLCNCQLTSSTEDAPAICEASQSDTFTIGTCGSCCESNNFLPGQEDQTCRNLTVTTPFCDASDSSMSGVCNKLKKKNRKGQLTLTFEGYDNVDTASCCQSCGLWGDPFGQAFDGSREKLIICDARGDDCVTDEAICNSTLDHAGNACVWNQTVQDLIGSSRANIGAYGSPCLPDWDLSGEAEVVLYALEESQFNLTFYTGERSILSQMNLKTASGSYTLDPTTCFDTSAYPGWTTVSGDSYDSALELTFTNGGEGGYGTDERVWAVYEPNSGIFFRVTCVRTPAVTTSYIGGYRLNVEKLIDVVSRSDASGYCETANLRVYGGDYTNSTIAEDCEEEDLSLALRACKAFWVGSCTPDEIELGVESWCKIANQPNTVSQCVQKITKKSNKIGNNWINAVCQALLPEKDSSQTNKEFIKACKALASSSGDPYSIVEEYGSAGDRTSVSSYCASSVAKYTTRDKIDPCVGGISVQYNPGSEWTELFFIPANLMPCNGELTIPAYKSKYWPLFIYPIQFVQCDLDNSEDGCPAQSNIEASCMPMLPLSVSYAYSYSGSVGCTSGSSQNTI